MRTRTLTSNDKVSSGEQDRVIASDPKEVELNLEGGIIGEGQRVQVEGKASSLRSL